MNTPRGRPLVGQFLRQEMSFAWHILHRDLSPQLRFPGLRWLWRVTMPRSGQFLRGVDISTYPSSCLRRTCHDPLRLGLLVPNHYLVAMWLQNLWRSLKLEFKTWLWSICLRTHIMNRSNRRSILENFDLSKHPTGGLRLYVRDGWVHLALISPSTPAA